MCLKGDVMYRAEHAHCQRANQLIPAMVKALMRKQNMSDQIHVTAKQ